MRPHGLTLSQAPMGFPLEWVAIFSSRGSFLPRHWTWISWVSCNGRRILYHHATWHAVSAPQTPVFTDVTQTKVFMHISHPKPGAGYRTAWPRKDTWWREPLRGCLYFSGETREQRGNPKSSRGSRNTRRRQACRGLGRVVSVVRGEGGSEPADKRWRGIQAEHTHPFSHPVVTKGLGWPWECPTQISSCGAPDWLPSLSPHQLPPSPHPQVTHTSVLRICFVWAVTCQWLLMAGCPLGVRDSFAHHPFRWLSR